MEHGDHLTPGTKRVGVNTNGSGLTIVVIAAVCLALFSWDFWKDGTKEINHYRLNTMPATTQHGEHGQGEKPGENPSSNASETVAPSSHNNASDLDTVSHRAGADSAKQHPSDSSANHTTH